MFVPVIATFIYAMYAVLYLALPGGLDRRHLAVRDLRRGLGGCVRVVVGAVLLLIPTGVIVSATLGA